ncbi:MAG: hypothetical protein GXO12_04090 [Epsilonproteobacteria bacterium]|nr:hypothetical protein [Campylobacterota bacterium]
MEQHLLSAIIAIMIVAFFMYKNINKVILKVDSIESNSFEFYSRYARIVERYIKELEEIVDKNSVLDNDRYLLSDETKRDEVKEELYSFIRKLAFFETQKAKEKDKKEIEKEFFYILSSLDESIKKYFKNGEDIADELREKLHEEYQKLKDMYTKT